MKNLIIISVIISIFYACANPKPLQGGPEDKSPPELENSIPENFTSSINPKTIEIEFNENIEENNIQQNLIITPSIDNPYKAKFKRKKVILEFEKPFKPNTTYTLYFNNSIKDITEGNVSKSLKYVFSTGSYIDSMQLKVNTKFINNEKVCEQCLVGLYDSEDTLTIQNSKPLYYGFTEKNGSIKIENIRPGKYYLYCLKDENQNYQYDENEIIGFADSLVSPDSTTPEIQISMIMEEQTKEQKIIAIRNNIFTYSITFNNLIKSFKITDTLYNKIHLNHWFSSNYDLNIIYKDSLFEGFIITHDTVNQIDTLKLVLKRNQESNHIQISKTKDNYKPSQKIELSLTNQPSLIVDSLMYFVQDSTKYPNNGWKLDTICNSLYFNPPKDLINYYLHIDSSALQYDTFSCRNFKLNIKLKEATETGTIKGTVNCKQTTILELLDDQYNLVETIYNPQTYTFDYLDPKSYRLRLIIDDNNNQKWDNGDFINREQPEKIIFHNSKIILRKNWEIKDINLSCPTK